MFRFTIRELVLVTVIVALAVGWWIDRAQLSQLNHSLRVRESERNFDLLRSKELSGKIILPAAPRLIERVQ
jgi:hypothetical protein